ncbi:MAG: hypothetical protein IJQ28_00470, partial [Clostridia bacterium]|nr:hypothetical protein [Clostridia bacterium]
FGYSFAYDNWGNLSQTSVGNYTLSQNSYNGPNGELSYTGYGNGDSFFYEYDSYGRLIKVYASAFASTEESNIILEYKYDAKNRIYKQIDYLRDNTTTYYYDLNGNLEETRNTSGVSSTTTTGEDSELETQTLNGFQFSSRETLFTSDGGVSQTEINNILKRNYSYDTLGRNDATTVQMFANVSSQQPLSTAKIKYKYLNYSDTDIPADTDTDRRTTNLTKSISYAKTVTANDTETDSNIASYSYKYDDNGNITSLYINGSLKETYTYDALNQLTRVTGHGTLGIPNTYYTYDVGGNITRARKTITNSRTQQTTTEYDIAYTYGDSDWHDLLTKYGSDNITYDNVGNPLNYRDGMTMTWERGRLLHTLTNSTATYGYEYDANGIRVSKFKSTANTDTDKYNYYYNDNANLLAMETPYGDLYFLYDEKGDIIGVRRINGNDDNIYTYVKNIQGDIMMLLDENSNVAAVYTYNAYGKVESVKTSGGSTITAPSNIGLLNPIRYRGYCYDNETGLYYLISRYYDPTTGRFVNADDPAY